MIERILADLEKIAGVTGVLVTGRDGLIIASEVSGDTDAEALGALATTVYTTSENSMKELNKGSTNQVIIEGDEGKILMVLAGEAILVVLTEPTVNLGYLRMEMKKSVSRIKAALG
ncbi:MAG: hypothetical protein GXO65_04915 [Euryarchaeota archaeon]|nr:hypothetical protein [Euryarchaeota archaeon]